VVKPGLERDGHPGRQAHEDNVAAGAGMRAAEAIAIAVAWARSPSAHSYRPRSVSICAARADAILKAYEKAEFDAANRLLRSLSSTVATSAAATRLIATWQNAWRESGS
jgi:hypothetical protein